ncbi:MAG: DUF3570 domain-containing protein [Vicinamibacterales bacterium]
MLASALAADHGAGAQQQEPALDIQFHGFTDSRGVTVLSPSVDFDRDFTDRMGLRLRFGVDAISAASDSCIRCHPEGAHNQRVFLNGSLLRVRRHLGVARRRVSKEQFYLANTAMTSVSRTFNDANTTVAGGYSFSWNRPTLHPSEFAENQLAQNAYVSVTQTLTRSTIAQVGYEVARIDGYQSNPFLRALLNGVRTIGEAPDHRLRHTLTARIRQALPGETYLEADYRHYTDDWDLRANSLSVGLSHYVTPHWLVSGTYRRHAQTGTYFYAPSYSGTPQFFTADFRLFPFDSNLYTGRVVYTPAGRLFAGMFPEGSGLTLQYEFYDATTGFQAATFSTGLRIPMPRR